VFSKSIVENYGNVRDICRCLPGKLEFPF
jgi:hypothetical protein